MLLHATGDRFCISRKGGTGGGVWVQIHVARLLLGLRPWFSLGGPFLSSLLSKQTSGLVVPPFLTMPHFSWSAWVSRWPRGNCDVL